MIIGIHPDKSGKESYSAHWAKAIVAAGSEVRWLDLCATDALNQVKGCDGVMWRWIHFPSQKQLGRSIMSIIEHQLTIPTFPNECTSWHYDNKVAQAFLLKSLNAPMPETMVFWREEDALRWTATAEYPLIVKLASGAGSQNVIKVITPAKARELVKEMFRFGVFPNTWYKHHPRTFHEFARSFLLMGKRALQAPAYVWSGKYPQLDRVFWQPERDYIYFQKYLAGNDCDTRVTIIGNRAFAFQRLNRPDDFRASGSGKIIYDPKRIDLRCIEEAFRVSRLAGFQCMAYDFLFDRNQPVIGEISYTFFNDAVSFCPGHWDSSLGWHEGPMRAETAQVELFLKQIELFKVDK